jgi:hypothetical protein
MIARQWLIQTGPSASVKLGARGSRSLSLSTAAVTGWFGAWKRSPAEILARTRLWCRSTVPLPVRVRRLKATDSG